METAEQHLYLGLPGIAASLWSYPVGAEPLVIGRAVGCDIRLGDRSVSRQHALVHRDPDGVAWLRDLESANGTWLCDRRVDEVPLEPGTCLRLGEYLTLNVASQSGSPDVSVDAAADALLRYWPDQEQPPSRDAFEALYSLALPLRRVNDPARAVQCVIEWLMDWPIAERTLMLTAADGTWRTIARKSRPGHTDPVEYNEQLVQRVGGSGEFAVEPEQAVTSPQWGQRGRVVVAGKVPGSEPTVLLYAEWTPQTAPWTPDFHHWVQVAGRLLGEALAAPPATTVTQIANGRQVAERLLGGPTLDTVRAAIGKAAESDFTVLITGETGTGKEVAARSIHGASSRSGGPFVACNCAAIAESLLESELFGHERGAFSGATQQHKGLFEQAHGGTLLLDEIGETSPELQAKLLRVIQDRAIQRVGGERTHKVDVRIIASTNRDLLQLADAGQFRRDLFYRLDEFPIHLPPLRDRTEDIPVLAAHFLNRHGERSRSLTAAAVDKLKSQPWPGNVRELESVIKRAILLCEADVIDADQLQIRRPRVFDDPDATTQLSKAELEREHALRVLESVDGNKSRAADILGIDRGTLRRKLKKWGE